MEVCTMNTRDWTKEEAEVISMEEYLAKRKKIREDERKHKKKGSDDREESLMPFEFYMVSSLAWSRDCDNLDTSSELWL